MIELRPYQRAAITAAWDYIRATETGNPIIEIATGGGKSIVLAKMMQEICHNSNRRVLMLSHVKELLSQNAEELIRLWQGAPVGIYSASLRKKQHDAQIVIAGIQSCYNKGAKLGFFHAIIVDEAHLISEKDDGMYRTLLAMLKAINPKIRIIGLTATPYRTKGGLLTEGEKPLFQEIVYSIGFRELVNMGYLCPIIGKHSKIQADLSHVGTLGGEFKLGEMEAAFDNEYLTERALDDIMLHGVDRKAWLIFCSGVDHAIHVRDNLIGRGIETACITGETPTLERDGIIRMFKSGEKYQALTNNTVLTTGTNIPRIDLLAILRATKSPGLFSQMAGRGSRLSPATGKENCILRDFGGNLERFGPIDLISAPIIYKGKRRGEMPNKICPECDSVWPISTKECADCGYNFPIDELYKHSTKASDAPTMSDDGAVWYDIDEVTYAEHIGKREKIESEEGITSYTQKPNTLKVTYLSGAKVMREWVCVNHSMGTWPRNKAKDWLELRLVMEEELSFEERYNLIDKFTIQDAIDYPDGLIQPLKIKVRKNGRFEEIVGYEF